jgi:hypothetical protein
MCRITYNGLIEVTYLDRNFAARVRDWPEIAHVTIAADPNRRARGRCTAFGTLTRPSLCGTARGNTKSRYTPYFDAGSGSPISR